ncbi:MAG TPA: type II toxin-antitoxin system Phd/YefM family antitoxin [Anaeromyxobacter sp.]
MKRTRRTIPASQFKARCLALLDEIGSHRETLIVTKRGRPVARVVGVGMQQGRSLRGSVTYHGDLLAPIGESWESER